MKLSETTLKTIGYIFIIIGICFQLAAISKTAKENNLVELWPIAILLWVIGLFFFMLAKKKKKKGENMDEKIK